jgi:response regulator of citrate/malate metabolism
LDIELCDERIEVKKQIILPQGKLIRLLSLINLLKGTRMTAEEIAVHFDISTRTAYRYIGILDVSGIMIEKDFKDRYYVIDLPVAADTIKNGYTWDYPKII